jgi:hypothetical protein
MIANRIISAGVLEDGKTIAAQNVGAYVWDSYKAGPRRFFRNSGSDNLIGWVKGDGRNDWWRPNAAAWDNNKSYENPITRDAYARERQLWEEKTKAAGVNVGPAKLATSATRPSH